MTQPSGPTDGEARPSWMGAPGYVPPPDLPPHAPMPGAPPYPPYQEPPAPVVDRGRTRFLTALGAALVWAAVNLALILLFAGAPTSARSLGRLVGTLLLPTLFAAVAAWLVLRRRARAFWVVVLVALPFFLLLRVLTVVGAAAS